MATLKEIVDKYGYGCKVKWNNHCGTTYYEILTKSPHKEYSYRLRNEDGGSYSDFIESSEFQVEYVSGGDKIKTNENILSRDDFNSLDKILSKALGQFKDETKKEFLNYLENDLPEMINEILTKKTMISIAETNEKEDKIVNLARICQLLFEVNVLVDDFTYERI